jgi:hypothetical protein
VGIGENKRNKLLTYISKYREACQRYELPYELPIVPIPVSVFLVKELAKKTTTYGRSYNDEEDGFRGVICLDPEVFSFGVGACWSFPFLHELTHCWLTKIDSEPENEVLTDLVAMCIFKEMIPHKESDYQCVLKYSYLSGEHGRKCLGDKMQKEALENPCRGLEEFRLLKESKSND